ncbi:MAG: hypothetical protein AAF633_19545 [Chloroflexota bacterium]
MTHSKPPKSLHARWTTFTAPLFAGPDATEIVWGTLDSGYSDPARAYHNWEHISECLALLDDYRSLCDDPILVEMAIWFHDLVYDTMNHQNELDSAESMEDCVVRAGWGKEDKIKKVYQLILDTKHTKPAASKDGELLVDIDLAIFGSKNARFWRYEQAIRQEYHWVEAEQYKKGRREILTRFLERPRLYSTPPLYERFEVQARVNLADSLNYLASS